MGYSCVYFLFTLLTVIQASRLDEIFVKEYCVAIAKTRHSVVFGCSVDDLIRTTSMLMEANQLVRPVQIRETLNITKILTRHIAASTCVVVDCSCSSYSIVLENASEHRYFNKSYQWLVMGEEYQQPEKVFGSLVNIGLNAQLTYAVKNFNNTISLYDIHSKGRHLNSSLEIKLFAMYSEESGSKIFKELSIVQGMQSRDNFNMLRLRSAIVIDSKNVNESDIDRQKSSLQKTTGFNFFTKFYSAILESVKNRFNFTLTYRIARAWSGRLPSGYRVGLLGIVQRNEADIPASGAFQRLNRFAEFDWISEDWKFEAGFVFRMTPDLNTGKEHGGSFTSPFEGRVWTLSATAAVIIIICWIVFLLVNKRIFKEPQQPGNFSQVVLNVTAAICQQDVQVTHTNTSVRLLIFTLLASTVLLYNYYTSSVVGGLLSNTATGPRTVKELINSPLMVSFEMTPYNRVLLTQSNVSEVEELKRVKGPRKKYQLPIISQINDAMPYIRRGEYAFHVEYTDAYPEIAKNFDADEICDLRTVGGLLETEKLGWILPKQSMYTETFRTMMKRIRETGIWKRELNRLYHTKPKCQSASTVKPVPFSGVVNALIILGFGALLSLLILIMEILCRKVDLGGRFNFRP